MTGPRSPCGAGRRRGMSAEWPLGRVLNLRELGPIGAVISRNDGESLEVCRLQDHPGWLLKRYRLGARPVRADQTLDRMISLPDSMSDADVSRIRDAAAWPVCRVVDSNQRTVGVVFREAPAWYRARFTVGPERSTESVLRLDWLCKPAEACNRRGLPFFDFGQRLEVCRSLVGVAAVLERHTVVYGDWSYRNAFWSITERSGFLIDMDSCGFGSRSAMQSPTWQDPSLNGRPMVDVTTDRYGVALLVARCLTAERDRAALLPKLWEVANAEDHTDLYDVVCRALTATPEHRPRIDELLDRLGTARSRESDALSLPPGANVEKWVLARPPVYAGGGTPTPPRQPAAPRVPVYRTPATQRRSPAPTRIAPPLALVIVAATAIALTMLLLVLLVF